MIQVSVHNEDSKKEEVRMTWDYRIVKYRDNTGCGLHEVFYDNETERPRAIKQKPSSFCVSKDETPEDLIKSLELALMDAKHQTVLDDPEDWISWYIDPNLIQKSTDEK